VSVAKAMTAAVLTEIPASALAIERRATPEPAADEVLIEVRACGICGTDLEILAGRSYRPEPPFVLGHEPVGEVVAAGAGVDPGAVGTRVAISIFRGRGETCAACTEHPEWLTPCRTGDQRLCIGGALITGVNGLSGGFADYVVAAQEQLVALPDELDWDQAAALVDSGTTAANAARQVPADDERAVAVVGGGPLGHLAAQMVRRRPLFGVEPLTGRRAELETLGVECVASVSELPDGLGAIVDCSGAPGVFAAGLEKLGSRGTFVVAGYAQGETNLAPLARKELVVRGVRSGRPDDLARALALVAGGDLRVPPISTWPLPEINDAFDRLRAGAVEGKAVIHPQHEPGGDAR
jgi:2-desacetyl-2-hydroxyethyl bacteriochlorophyllide A dehydrogenase